MTCKPSVLRFPFTKEWLTEEYVTKGRSAEDIAAETGYTPYWVNIKLRRVGIERRGRWGGPKDFPVDAAWLRQKYEVEGQTIAQIAAELNWSSTGLYQRMLRAGVKMRAKQKPYSNTPDKEWFIREYLEKGRSLPDMAEELGVSYGTVGAAIARHQLPRRVTGIRVRGIAPTNPRALSKKVGSFHWKQKEHIQERDGFRCQMDNCTSVSDLEIHHILPRRFGGRDCIANGITLCHKCHRRVHGRELEWADKFLLKIKSRKSQVISA